MIKWEVIALIAEGTELNGLNEKRKYRTKESLKWITVCVFSVDMSYKSMRQEVDKMCDRIIMSDGSEIESIKGEDECLCGNSQREILIWIVEHLPALEFDETVSINRDPFGYFVSISKKDAQDPVKREVEVAP